MKITFFLNFVEGMHKHLIKQIFKTQAEFFWYMMHKDVIYVKNSQLR